MNQNEKAIERYQAWLNDALIDEATKEELRSIEGQEKEISSREQEFHCHILAAI